MKTESKEQIEVIQWCKRNTHLHPELDEIFWIRNESKSKRVRIMGKLMGIKTGIPDLLLPVARRNFHGLFIEMKRVDGGLSPAQKKRIPKLKA
ncbi:MAG: VRR-NUC domain-containing protein, partial [Nanoarchaeota archaeon]|nr:VRR-NUC domain-containing protein [Nanoarchaeota archaeon]